MKILDRTRTNEQTIELIKKKLSPYSPIYSLNQVELEILKTFIDTYLKTGFNCLSKSPLGAPILFDQKSERSFRLSINY